MNNYDYEYLTPFKWFILENFPFIEADFDALTNWQLFEKLGKEINKIIKNVNLTGEQVENLTNAFNELKNYVDNYFENLDVQDEINNKLDEMTEEGTLQEIITAYLQIAGILAFDTVADMKASTNLINGSFVETYGFYAKGDLGSAKYKIRTITNNDVVDESTIIALNDNDLIAELIETPAMNIKQFGGKHDEETNEASLLQKMINSTKIEIIDLLNKTFVINTAINLKSNLILKNGVIKCNNLENVFNGTDLENFVIDNLEFDGNNNCQRGIYLLRCKNFKITNCKFHNFEILTGTTCGINPHSCQFGLISNCESYDIGNNSVGDEHYEPRGFVIENSTNIEIDKCYVHDIYTTNDHGDGIQFLSPLNRDISKNIVRNTVIQDCIYRGIKLQQKGVTIDGCKIIEGENDRSLIQSGIAVYDSDITIQNCYISQKCDIAITIGSSTTITTVANNVTIQNNIFDFKNSISYGVIAIPNIAEMVENLNIINNKFNILDENKKPYSILLLGKFNKVNIANNIFNGGEQFIVIKKASGDNNQSKNNLSVIGNIGNTKQMLVRFDDNVEITNGIIVGNTAYYDTPLSFVSGQNSVQTGDATLFKTFKISNNQISSSDNSIHFYDGPRNYGATGSRPTTAVNNGFQYFDVTLHQMVTYYSGSWYLPDGTVAS